MNRSQLVHIARAQVANRFQLIHLTAAITRAFHKPGKQCIGKTINEALERIAAKGETQMTSTDYIRGLEMESQVFDVPELPLDDEQEEEYEGTPIAANLFSDIRFSADEREP